jgi:hypothetical protein
MELEAIEGAAASLAKCRPALIAESMKSDQARLHAALQKHGYRLFASGINVLAIHSEDKMLKDFEAANGLLFSAVKLGA